MPTYLIKCVKEKCDYEKEIFCSYDEMKKHKCKKCKNSKTKQIFTSCRFILKGGGFYSTNKNYNPKRYMEEMKYLCED